MGTSGSSLNFLLNFSHIPFGGGGTSGDQGSTIGSGVYCRGMLILIGGLVEDVKYSRALGGDYSFRLLRKRDRRAERRGIRLSEISALDRLHEGK